MLEKKEPLTKIIVYTGFTKKYYCQILAYSCMTASIFTFSTGGEELFQKTSFIFNMIVIILMDNGFGVIFY